MDDTLRNTALIFNELILLQRMMFCLQDGNERMGAEVSARPAVPGARPDHNRIPG